MSERIIKNAPQLLQKPTSGFYEQPGKHDLEKTHCVQISGSQFLPRPPILYVTLIASDVCSIRM